MSAKTCLINYDALFNMHPNSQIHLDTPTTPAGLVNAQGLLSALFAEPNRPTTRWLRRQQQLGIVPFYKVGHFTLFDVDECRSVMKAMGRRGGRT